MCRRVAGKMEGEEVGKKDEREEEEKGRRGERGGREEEGRGG